MIIAKTPYRISFFGGGTDYTLWSKEHGGEVISTTIDKYCYISCRYLPPFFNHKYRFVYSKIESVNNIDEIQHPSAKAVLTEYKVPGVEIHHDGDLPAYSGLGSSSSFTVSLLNAVSNLQGIRMTKKKLAQEAIRIEQSVIKETVGSQDQIAVSYGGFNHIRFHKDGNFDVEPVVMTTERLNAFESHILIVFTGISRNASKIAGGLIDNLLKNSSNMSFIANFVSQGLTILNDKNIPLSDFGLLLDESWQVKKKLHESVSNSTIDLMYKKALEAGAVGGKIMGAGGGGFLMLFANKKNHNDIKNILSPRVIVPILFDRGGSQIVVFEPDGL